MKTSNARSRTKSRTATAAKATTPADAVEITAAPEVANDTPETTTLALVVAPRDTAGEGTTPAAPDSTEPTSAVESTSAAPAPSTTTDTTDTATTTDTTDGDEPVHEGEIVPVTVDDVLAYIDANPNTGEGPSSEPPPEPVIKGRPFAEIYADVMRRADAMLPDRVVHVADLRMTAEGHLALPDSATLRLNDWARKQLASMLGLRWDRWFQSSSGEERAEEINRRFARTPGERKIRAWKDREGRADGVARAIVASTFSPIDDRRLFERMQTMMKGLVDEYRFTRVEWTDSTTHYVAVHTQPFDLDGEMLYPGWHLRNSEVGASALSLDDHWMRLACLNGLMLRVGGKRSLYRTHRAIDDDQLAAALVIAVGRLPERWQTAFGWMKSAKALPVPHPDTAIAALLDEPSIPRALVEAAQREVLRGGDATRFGVVQAVTLVAHRDNQDPDVRFTMERLAGDYLAAQPLTGA